MPPLLHALLAALPWLRCALLAVLALLAAGAASAAAEAPPRLSDTGLFVPGTPERLRPGVRGFQPQYVLWSDGASKRRWILLPRGASIDARDADAWRFPRGTKLWKEFAVDGRAVETRYIEHRADGGWTFASYVWNEAGSDALLAPERGVSVAVAGAPGGRYAVPGRFDCLACHGGAPTPVLGFSALQLSSDRDPLAPHAKAALSDDLDLQRLLSRGLLRGLPDEVAAQPPRIAAGSDLERAALGYLHANCGHCHHRAGGQVPVALTLAQRMAAPAASRAEVLQSLVEAPSRFQPPRPLRHPASLPIVAPGQPHASVLVARLQSRQPLIQMPPLGTQVPDAEGLALVQRWIAHDLPSRKEH